MVEAPPFFRLAWAKAASDGSGKWLPLYVHSSDTAEIASKLWNNWLSPSTRNMIVSAISPVGVDAEAVIRFISCSHDIGKCIPEFQSRRIHGNDALTEVFRTHLIDCNMPFRDDLSNRGAIPHSCASQWILERNGVGRSLSVVAGAHHGKPPDALDKIGAYCDNTGSKSAQWVMVQDALFKWSLTVAGLSPEDVTSIKLSAPGQALMMGLVTMADWIASNELLFPLGTNSEYSDEELKAHADRAWSIFRPPAKWEFSIFNDIEGLFETRFNYTPRPFQSEAVRAALQSEFPGIFVIEAPMGEGKTEAALEIAETVASRYGLSGVFFALPTQATADGMFSRFLSWMKSVGVDEKGAGTVFLAHGKAAFNSDFNSIPRGTVNSSDGYCTVHQWFTGSKKGILSDFVVGTVDQILMMALKRRYLALRHLGISGKVVIIDEVHAYDQYMGSYLAKALEWLGAYGVPVVLLSATLPRSRRRELVEAYLGRRASRSLPEGWYDDDRYPLITNADRTGVKIYAPPASSRRSRVRMERIGRDDVVVTVKRIASGGGYVGVILNTVSRAQETYLAL
jgi:CRISPR-associated endonuclease/helicase Cas3